MKRAIIALALGLAFGYRWGFADATQRKPTVVQRVLDRFGTTQVKNAQQSRERQVEAIKP